ncbi:MAG TPA: 2-oxo acid dehydrogenase subunit E2, partial [Usitatibacter sp.]|nr:2-oxo acid dehydrogenase subunit E2 [Usitatibacter sp.]
MQVEVKVPQLSESVSEATLVAWRKKPGEAVKRDENLIDIETDKVVLELPAPADGVLAKIVKNDGESVTSGELLAVIDTEAKPTVGSSAPPGEKPTVAPVPTGAQKAAAPAAAKAASPSASKIAAEKGIDTATVQGSGRDGRVTKADVLAAPPVAAAPSVAPAKAGAQSVDSRLRGNDVMSGSRTEQRVPMSRLRQRIAERLVQSQSTAAILTTFNEANMAPVMELRARYREKFEKEHGVKLGFMSFFVKASIEALRRFPAVNASLDGADIVYHEFYDI